MKAMDMHYGRSITSSETNLRTIRYARSHVQLEHLLLPGLDRVLRGTLREPYEKMVYDVP
jgi:hypothetical protein